MDGTCFRPLTLALLRHRAPLKKEKREAKKRAWSQGRPQRTHPTGQVVLGYVQIVVKKRYFNFQGWLHPEPGCIINLEMILGQHERSSKKKQNKDIHRPSIERSSHKVLSPTPSKFLGMYPVSSRLFRAHHHSFSVSSPRVSTSNSSPHSKLNSSSFSAV